MAITDIESIAIDGILSQLSDPVEALMRLRQDFPHLRWLSCDAADVAEDPAKGYAMFDLHYLDCAGHCVQVVADVAQASGILLAQRRVA